jgi:hypothetical protein
VQHWRTGRAGTVKYITEDKMQIVIEFDTDRNPPWPSKTELRPKKNKRLSDASWSYGLLILMTF